MHCSIGSRLSCFHVKPLSQAVVYTHLKSPSRSQLASDTNRTRSTMAGAALLHGDTFFLDNFAVRQWDDPNYSGTRLNYDKADFVDKVWNFLCMLLSAQ